MTRKTNRLPAERRGGILSRLLRDSRGNTLALAAAAIFPLIGMIGGGVDLARAHTAKSRLQQACDAGALAGRRAMSGASLTEAAKSEALKFFNFNFAQGQYGSAPFTPEITSPSAGVVRVSATTSVPTSLMQVFGFDEIDLQVECEATRELENLDIMLVLDTTGSMNCTPEEPGTCGRGSEISTSRIVALRKAVMTLYEELEPTQTQLAAQGLRLRFGILPFSSTVNVGLLVRAAHPQYMAQRAQYFTCKAWNADSSCKNGVSQQRNIAYTNEDYNKLNDNPGGRADARSWTGCIQERATVDTITPSTTSLPSGALDLDVDNLPVSNDESSSWAPYLPDEVLGELSTACPKAASHLATRTESQMQAAVDALVAAGYTYHDIGMIWGARMISSGGIFGDLNPATYNGYKVRKHIIFMTDGEMCPNVQTYSAYGIESMQKRVTGTQSQAVNCSPSNYGNLNNIHNKRFELACQQAAAIGASIWTVAFSTTMTSQVEACAGPGQALSATNEEQLISQFRTIAKSIGALRVSR